MNLAAGLSTVAAVGTRTGSPAGETGSELPLDCGVLNAEVVRQPL